MYCVSLRASRASVSRRGPGCSVRVSRRDRCVPAPFLFSHVVQLRRGERTLPTDCAAFPLGPASSRVAPVLPATLWRCDRGRPGQRCGLPLRGRRTGSRVRRQTASATSTGRERAARPSPQAVGHRARGREGDLGRTVAAPTGGLAVPCSIAQRTKRAGTRRSRRAPCACVLGARAQSQTLYTARHGAAGDVDVGTRAGDARVYRRLTCARS